MSHDSFLRPALHHHGLSRGASHGQVQSSVGCLPESDWPCGVPLRDSAGRLKSVRAKPYARGGGSSRGGCIAKGNASVVGFQTEDELYDRMPAYLTSFSTGHLLPCHNKQDIAHAALLCQNMQKSISSGDLKALEDDEEMERVEMDHESPPCNEEAPCILRPSCSLSRLEEIKLSEVAEANERRIIFLGRLPAEWTNPEGEIRAILDSRGFGPIVKVTVKQRETGFLDSYAFVYFEDTRAAHAALDFLQKHRKYRLLNVSFGGRDQFLLGQEYADLDGLPEAVASVCPTMHPNEVAAQLYNGRGLLRSTSQDSFSDLLKAHRRWQQKQKE